MALPDGFEDFRIQQKKKVEKKITALIDQYEYIFKDYKIDEVNINRMILPGFGDEKNFLYIKVELKEIKLTPIPLKLTPPASPHPASPNQEQENP